MFEKKQIKMICLCAVSCAGKTTYTNSIVGEDNKYDQEFGFDGDIPMVLRLGKIFREVLGDEFFKDLPRPFAPELTENLARNMVYNFTKIAYECGRTLIIDGFPRTSEQMSWLVLSSYASTVPVEIEMRFLYADAGDIVCRRNKRLEMCKTNDARLALEQRFENDASSFIQVYEKTKEIINLGRHELVTMKEFAI